MLSRSFFLKSIPSFAFAAFAMIALSFASGCASTRFISYTAPSLAQTEPPIARQAEIPAKQASEASSPRPPEPIKILGGVKNPGNIPYREGADLSFYLSKAGAPEPETDPTRIQIIRGEPGKKKAQEFDLANGTSPSLRSGDIVIVHPPKKTFLERSITVAASAAAIIGTAALLILVV